MIWTCWQQKRNAKTSLLTPRAERVAALRAIGSSCNPVGAPDRLGTYADEFARRFCLLLVGLWTVIRHSDYSDWGH